MARKVRAARRRRLVRQWLPAQAAGAEPDVGARFSRRARAAALAAVALGIVLVGVLRFGNSAPGVEAPPALPAAVSSAPSSSATAGAAESSAPMVVSVVGKVRHVGLVTVPPGSRVADVIAKAGGALPKVDLVTVNLARPVSDGEQIYVGIPVPAGVQQPQAPASAGASPGTSSGGGTVGGQGKVDLNSASAEQLDQLPGVGEVTAKRIIDWRTQHGRFRAVTDLQEVDGIGETRFSRLKDLVSVG